MRMLMIAIVERDCKSNYQAGRQEDRQADKHSVCLYFFKTRARPERAVVAIFIRTHLIEGLNLIRC